MEDKTCSKCKWRCYAVHYAGMMNEQFCMANHNVFLKGKFENYNEYKHGCEKFEKGKHSFYGKPVSTK